jgi:hypothetical protein
MGHAQVGGGQGQSTQDPSQPARWRFTNVGLQGAQCMNLPAPASCGFVGCQVAVILHQPCANMKDI